MHSCVVFLLILRLCLQPTLLPEVFAIVAQMHLAGAAPFFRFFDGADNLQPLLDIGQLNQAGLGLFDVTNYLDPHDAGLRANYTKHVAKILNLAGLFVVV